MHNVPLTIVDDYMSKFELDVVSALETVATLQSCTKCITVRPTAKWMSEEPSLLRSMQGLCRDAKHTHSVMMIG